MAVEPGSQRPPGRLVTAITGAGTHVLRRRQRIQSDDAEVRPDEEVAVRPPVAAGEAHRGPVGARSLITTRSTATTPLGAPTAEAHFEGHNGWNQRKVVWTLITH